MSFVTTAEGNTLYYEHHLPEGPSKTPIVISCAFCTVFIVVYAKTTQGSVDH